MTKLTWGGCYDEVLKWWGKWVAKKKGDVPEGGYPPVWGGYPLGAPPGCWGG